VFRDLSRPVKTGMQTYPGDPAVSLAPDATHEADGYATSELRTGTHAGTHVDAPRHTVPGGAAIDEPGVGTFAFDARLVDLRPLSPREAVGPESLPEPSDLDGVDLVVCRTGWAARWGTDAYRDHPYLTAAAAERCREAGAGVGLDAFGPDPTPPADEAGATPDGGGSTPDGGGPPIPEGGAPIPEDGAPIPEGGASTASDRDEPGGTPAHDVLLGASLPVVENLRGLDGLPDRFRLYAFPLRLRGADGSPVRAVAEWQA
jgi:kynurenine formamidase